MRPRRTEALGAADAAGTHSRLSAVGHRAINVASSARVHKVRKANMGDSPTERCLQLTMTTVQASLFPGLATTLWDGRGSCGWQA